MQPATVGQSQAVKTYLLTGGPQKGCKKTTDGLGPTVSSSRPIIWMFCARYKTRGQ